MLGYNKRCEMVHTQNGQLVQLQVFHHNDRLCREFAISSQQFYFRRWLFWTALFNVFGFFIKLHTKDSYTMTALVVLAVLAVAAKFNFKAKRESLTVVSNMGVQLRTTYASGRTTSKFYDMGQIISISINEAVTMHKVLFYLTLIVKESTGQSPATNTTKLIPVFAHTWPSLDCLQTVYKSVQAVLALDKT